MSIISSVARSYLLITVALLGFPIASTAMAQEQQITSHQTSGHNSNKNPSASTETPSGVNRPPRVIHRVGTAIPAPRNSVSIKSTDAGYIPRQPAVSGCINCGIIDFIQRSTSGNVLNAITSGVVAGTIAREVNRQLPYPGSSHPQYGTGIVPMPSDGNIATNPYQVGITLHDGSQAIIALPDVSHLQQGDRVQLIDGAIVIDR